MNDKVIKHVVKVDDGSGPGRTLASWECSCGCCGMCPPRRIDRHIDQHIDYRRGAIRVDRRAGGMT